MIHKNSVKMKKRKSLSTKKFPSPWRVPKSSLNTQAGQTAAV